MAPPNSSRLQRLEADARLQPNNANKQAEFYAELNRVDPWATVRRFESQQFAANDQCVKEYLAALARVQRLDRVVPLVSQGIATGGLGSAAAAVEPAMAGAEAAAFNAAVAAAAPASSPAYGFGGAGGYAPPPAPTFNPYGHLPAASRPGTLLPRVRAAGCRRSPGGR